VFILAIASTGSPFEADVAGWVDLTKCHGELWLASADVTAVLSGSSIPAMPPGKVAGHFSLFRKLARASRSPLHVVGLVLPYKRSSTSSW
jgi:hypothetical protein